MKAKLLAMLLLGGTALFAETHVHFNIGINTGRGGYYVPPPPPPPPVRYVPRSPGRGYVWVPGFWITVGNRYDWRDGYWAPPVRGYGYGSGNSYGNGRNNGRGHGNGRNRDRDHDRDRD